MPTKAELEAQIKGLETDILNLRKLHEEKWKDWAIISLPWAKHNAFTGGAPYVRDGDFRERLMPVICDRIRKYGIPVDEVGYLKSVLHVRLGEGNGVGSSYLLPVMWADMIIEVLDSAASFAQQCHNDGFKDGSDLLNRLVENDISADEFNNSCERHKAKNAQAYKSFRRHSQRDSRR